MNRVWLKREQVNPEQVQLLAGELSISEELATLFCSRNATTGEKAKTFLNPALDQLHDPFLMNDMQAAVNRIGLALDTHEKILVYGDYDVDGTTAVSLVYSFLASQHTELGYYIPDRYTEGYGISRTSIDWAREKGFKLIIALDCGIKSVELVAYAATLGIDYIIADHHLPGDELPGAVAVLDPKRKDSTYPFSELSGCGIGYKLVTALARHRNIKLDEDAYLDLVAVSIASDMVEVVGENRVLAFAGLRKLNRAPCTGLKALITLAGIKGPVTFKEVLFQLGPRINAAGRMADAALVVELLTTADFAKAAASALILDERNNKRKVLDAAITREALELLRENPDWETNKSTVLYHPQWHKGVVGIVASRVIESHYRPTIILTSANGKATGSARSVSGFDIYAAIDSCKDLLDQFGGHKYAAGLSLDISRVQEFTTRFEEVVSKGLDDDAMVRKITYDCEISPAKLQGGFLKHMMRLAPFGPGNHQPVFMSRNLRCSSKPSLISQKHLKFEIRIHEKEVFSCIGFNMDTFFTELSKGKSFDICYSVEENTWNGTTRPQLIIKDLILNTPLNG